MLFNSSTCELHGEGSSINLLPYSEISFPSETPSGRTALDALHLFQLMRLARYITFLFWKTRFKLINLKEFSACINLGDYRLAKAKLRWERGPARVGCDFAACEAGAGCGRSW